MSSNERSWRILEMLKEIHDKDSDDTHVLRDRIKAKIQCSEAELVNSIQRLETSSFINVEWAGAGNFSVSISGYGIDEIEKVKGVSNNDDKVRQRILETLKDAYDKDPYDTLVQSTLIEKVGFNELEVRRNVKYLEIKGYIKVQRFLGGNYMASIEPGYY